MGFVLVSVGVLVSHGTAQPLIKDSFDDRPPLFFRVVLEQGCHCVTDGQHGADASETPPECCQGSCCRLLFMKYFQKFCQDSGSVMLGKCLQNFAWGSWCLLLGKCLLNFARAVCAAYKKVAPFYWVI